MRIEDFKVGQRVIGIGPCGNMGYCKVIKVEGDRVLVLTEDRRSSFLIQHNPEYWMPAPEPAQDSRTTQSWDYAEAERLYRAATDAIEQYNQYIQRKPDTYFGSISVTGTYVPPTQEDKA